MKGTQNTINQIQGNEIVLYQPNDSIHLEVRMANESVWLTQSQIALLFGVGQPAISKHLNNIFKSGELDESSVYSILEYYSFPVSHYLYVVRDLLSGKSSKFAAL